MRRQGIGADGDLVIQPADKSFGGDGIIRIRVIGSAFGLPEIHQIFFEREAFDRISSTEFTFPGGWRHQQSIPPHFLARHNDGGIELTPQTSTQSGLSMIFGEHRWEFAVSEQFLPESEPR